MGRTLTPEDVTREYLDTARPGRGSVTYEPGYTIKNHRAEIAMADWLHRMLGGDVRLLRESEKDSIKRPDFMWRGLLWELKGAASIQAADKRLQYALKQIQDNPGGVILKIPELDMQALERQLTSRIKRSRTGGLDLMILVDGELERILRYKK